MRRLVVANGPNLNFLGAERGQTLADIQAQMDVLAAELGLEVSFFQSNHEGEIIDRLQAEAPGSLGVIINPASYGSYSIALYDCLKALSVPVVEVHLGNLLARGEGGPTVSVTAPAARGVIAGLGGRGYVLAMEYLNGLDE